MKNCDANTHKKNVTSDKTKFNHHFTQDIMITRPSKEIDAKSYPYDICVSYLREVLLTRDDSHGVSHALAVHQNCIELWVDLGEGIRYVENYDSKREIKTFLSQGPQGKFTSWFYISASALLHDVCDHKYHTSDDNVQKFKSFVTDTVCQGDKDAANIILTIIENVSYSREKKGLLQKANLPNHIMAMRDIVSDADKIEALGEMGIERCIEFTKSRVKKIPDQDQSAYEALIMKDVSQHCDDKLLHLLPFFIRTPGGKAMAKPHHDFIVKWQKDWKVDALS